MPWESQLATRNLIDPAPAYVNHSGYSHSHAILKAQSRPQGCVPVEERKEGSGIDSKFTVTWQVPKSVEIRFLQWVIGYSFFQQIGTSSGGQAQWRMSRVIPDQHFESPAHYATRFSPKGAGGVSVQSATSYPLARLKDAPAMFLDAFGNPVVDFHQSSPLIGPGVIDNQGYAAFDGKVLYDVDYTIPDYTILTDAELDQQNADGPNAGELRRFCRVKFDWNVQGVPIGKIATGTSGNQLLKFSEPTLPQFNTTVPEGGLLLVPSGRLQITWIGVPDIPHDGIQTALGHVNAGKFGGIQRIPKFDNQTLLMESPKTMERAQITGRVGYDIDFSYAWKPVYPPANKDGSQYLDSVSGLVAAGWNCFPTAFDGNFYPARLGGQNGQQVFQAINFDMDGAQAPTYPIIFAGNPWQGPTVVPRQPRNYVGNGDGIV